MASIGAEATPKATPEPIPELVSLCLIEVECECLFLPGLAVNESRVLLAISQQEFDLKPCSVDVHDHYGTVWTAFRCTASFSSASITAMSRIECAWAASRTKDCFFNRFSYHQTVVRKKNKMKYKGEEFRHQQDNQEKDRIIRQKDSIINDYRERIGHYFTSLYFLEP